MPKKQKLQQADEPAQTIEHIVRESGVTDEPTVERVVRNLKPFWAKTAADAQVRGFKIRKLIDKESHDTE